MVLCRSFWLQSTNTRPPRCSFAMVTVTRFGSRDSSTLPEREREALRGLGVDRRPDPHREVQSLRPRRLRHRAHPELVEQVVQLERDARAVAEVGAGPGIEVEHDRRRQPRLGGPGLGRVQLQRGEVGRPHERGHAVERAGRDLGVGVERHGVEPLRPVARAALLEEPLAGDAVGKAHHRDRAVVRGGGASSARSGRRSRSTWPLVKPVAGYSTLSRLVRRRRRPSTSTVVAVLERPGALVGARGHDLRR